MSATRPIIDAVVEHLQAAIPWVNVEAFPERPSEYQFIHPVGAILVGYGFLQLFYLLRLLPWILEYGFAVGHCIGILTSMFSSVVVSRTFVNLWYGRRRKLSNLSIGITLPTAKEH